MSTVASNLILLIAVTLLFLMVRWYFSNRLLSNVKSRLHSSGLVMTIVVALMVSTIITNKSVLLMYRYLFFLSTFSLFVVINLIAFRHLQYLKSKRLVFPKSYLIYHDGNFYRGPIRENKISEEDIISTLHLKGVDNLKLVDSIILEADGELTVIYKKKIPG